jgi:hypothetical protein
MKRMNLFIPSILAFLSTSLFFRTFEFFNLNIGSLWVNVRFYYVILIGFLLTYLISLSKLFRVFLGFVLFLYFFSFLVEKNRLDSIPVFVLLVYLIFALINNYLFQRWFSKRYD